MMDYSFILGATVTATIAAVLILSMMTGAAFGLWFGTKEGDL